ncbi:DUF6362 family protein [Orrella sp. 11846]|uniref:DUF6362 family protein n=1 Tax=Orrella sp. 11846 TaxID=3409913 RepID=UPI003B5CB95D
MNEPTDIALEEIAARLSAAAHTARRLPPVKVQGYFNLWPTIVRSRFEMLEADDREPPRFPPSPRDIEAMLEVMRWVQCLEPQARHLVWMRAKGYGWGAISKRFGCDRTTAWRRWKAALGTLAEQSVVKNTLNSSEL